MLKNAESYQGFDNRLLNHAKNIFLHEGFSYHEPTFRGALFVNQKSKQAILLDHRICDKRFPFHYTIYTKEQNALMHQYKGIYRFTTDTLEDLSEAKQMLNILMSENFKEDNISVSGRNREWHDIDPTMPEAYFEQAFIDCYGREALNRVNREFPIIDINGQTRWVDYYIQKNGFDLAVEKNGESFHHPIIIGKDRYKRQLIKQNSLVAYGTKVFRWSIEGMKSTDNFLEEMRLFFGDKNEFFIGQKISVSREFSLFDHQENIMENIQAERLQGKSSFLVVLPTGTGKTEILIADYAREFKAGNVTQALIMVPSRQLKIDMIEKFRNRLTDHDLPETIAIGEKTDNTIAVQTYAWMSRHFSTFDFDKFDYVAVDEAHHAVAPTVQKVIQSFNPKTLIGFTATDQRLDKKELRTVFGKYQTNFSLFEAIQKKLLAPIKAFRIKSNIDLSDVRFNGKDYMNSDLQRQVIVPSRDQLIVDVLLKYFVNSELPMKQGLIFCVSVKHAQRMAHLMDKHKISVAAVSGDDSRSTKYIEEYQSGKIQFLTTCSLLNEGWDSPQTAFIVMARPTMSKVLYTQQLGRGTRTYPGKEALYVIDVVDNYGGMGNFTNRAWSIHALLGIEDYMPWSNILEKDKGRPSPEEIIIEGLYEEERAVEKINIFTFEKEYPHHISDEQLARELFVSTGTVKAWIKKGKIVPVITVPLGRRRINYFAPAQIEQIRTDLKLKQHDETTQYDDFFEFIETRDFTMSYKMVMLLTMLTIVDNNGECDLDTLTEAYTDFYRHRIESELQVDKTNCPYQHLNTLDDRTTMKKSLLQNPFEKFERKRFLYHCKDLNRIAFSNTLWQKINNTDDLYRIKVLYFESLQNYYEDLGGLPNKKMLQKEWGILEQKQIN